MKSKFPGYFKPTDTEITELWENATFILDANVLLNLYRYSDDTREEYLKILEKVEKRIWIPNQAAKEFLENRLNVIDQQEKAYDSVTSSLNKIETEFKKSRQHPFISQKLLKKFSALANDICTELKQSKNIHSQRIINDDVLSKIENLFKEKVGDCFSQDELSQLSKIAEERFDNKIPPGFKDANKTDSTQKNIRKYGDFFLWKQILNKSKELKSNIILVTDDRKEDWWVKFKGKTLQPRPELKKEFIETTGNKFHMYQSDRFLEFAIKFLDEKINQKAINEIRELRKYDEQKFLRELLVRQEKLFKIKAQEKLYRERIRLKDEQKYIRKRRKELENQLDIIYLLAENESDTLNEHEIIKLKDELNMIKKKEKKLLLQAEELEFMELYELGKKHKTTDNKD